MKVKKPSCWDLLKDMDLEPYSINDSASNVFDIEEIADRLGTDCFVISDTTDEASEPFEYMVCYFGDDVISMFAEENGEKFSDMFSETDIYDVEDWIERATEVGLDLVESDIEYLSDFDIYLGE